MCEQCEIALFFYETSLMPEYNDFSSSIFSERSYSLGLFSNLQGKRKEFIYKYRVFSNV